VSAWPRLLPLGDCGLLLEFPPEVSPEINATAAMILGFSLVAIVIAYLVLRRAGQGREAAAVPGV